MDWKERYAEFKKGDKVKVITKHPHCNYGCDDGECQFFEKIGIIEHVYSTSSGSIHIMFNSMGCSRFKKEDLEHV